MVYSADGRLQEGRLPLSVVVTDAVRRWYLEAEKEAQRGDVVSIAVSCCFVVFCCCLGRKKSKVK